ncbi:MAG: hypothetical protein WC309_01520 [Candidatus Paceibacterota bacterium]|jgi:hypothetical protein
MKENNSEIEEKKLYNRIQNLLYKKIDALRDSKEYVEGYLEKRDLLYELSDEIENLMGAKKENFDSNKCFICGGTGNIDEYRKNFNCAVCKGEFNTDESPLCFICRGCMTAEEDGSNYYASNKLKEALRLLELMLFNLCFAEGLKEALRKICVKETIFFLNAFRDVEGLNLIFQERFELYNFQGENTKEYLEYKENLKKRYGGEII